MKMKTILSIPGLVLAGALFGCQGNNAELESLRAQVAEMEKTKAMEEAHLAAFDDLDFNVYTNQKWDELGNSHGQDITVHWPDGRTTQGIEAHIADLKAGFVFAPDTHITEHPVKIASGDWTAVMGVAEGTFTEPMPVEGGEPIPPTGKSFRIEMVTVAHWTDGVMDEEWLKWDNESYLKQIGLAE